MPHYSQRGGREASGARTTSRGSTFGGRDTFTPAGTGQERRTSRRASSLQPDRRASQSVSPGTGSSRRGSRRGSTLDRRGSTHDTMPASTGLRRKSRSTSMLPELRSNSYLGQPMIEARQLRSNSHADLPSIYVQAPKLKGKQPQGPREEDGDLRDEIKVKKEQQRKYNEWKARKDKQYAKEHGEPFRRTRPSKVAAADEPNADALGGASILPTLQGGTREPVGFAAVTGLKRAEGEFGSTSGEKGIGIFAMLAAAKFKRGGRKNHDAWLESKAKAEWKKKNREMQQAELEVALEEFEASSRHEEFVQTKLATATAMHSHLKKKLYRESTLDEFKPERPDSGRGAIPLLDELKLASEEENWEVGIAICKLKDRLDEIAPGERTDAAKQKRGKARAKSFPRHLPPRPTRESVIHHIDSKELF